MSDQPAASPASPAPSTPETAPVTGTEAKPTNGEDKPAVADLNAAVKKKFKIKTKIDGIEEEDEIDEDQVQRDYQIWKASNKRFQEASGIKKQVEEVLGLFKSPEGIVKALQRLGYTEDQIQTLSENFLYGRLKTAAMTPEQRRVLELEAWKRQREEEDGNRKTQEEKQRSEAALTVARGEIEKDIIGALEGSAIPPTPQNVWRMGSKMRIALERGISLNSKQAAEAVYQDLISEYRHIAGKMPAEKFVEVIGQDAANMIRKHDLSKVTNQFTESRAKRPKGETPFEKPKKKFTTEKEFEKYLDAKKAERA